MMNDAACYDCTHYHLCGLRISLGEIIKKNLFMLNTEKGLIEGISNFEEIIYEATAEACKEYDNEYYGD